MKKLLLTLITILYVSFSFAQQKQGIEIMQQVQNQTDVPDEYREIKMELKNSRGKKLERDINQYIQRENGLRKSLITFTNPSDIRGSGFLSLENENREDDNWLYLPALRKSRRISSTNLTDKFMGSDFTYEDMEDEDIKKFTYKYLGEEEFDNRQCYSIEAVPFTPEKIKETGYSKRVLLVDKATFVMTKILYFDHNGKNIKTFEARDMRKIEGTEKWRAHNIVITDHQKEHSSQLSISVIKSGKTLDPTFFSKRTLEAGI